VNKGISRIFNIVKKSLALRVGATVRKLRVEKGLSQVVFSERCGFYQTYLSRLERGQANPTLNALEVIALAFNLSIFEFFEQVRKQ
jgi:transcriptional regulator with XRE-family HTH domain